MFGWLFKAARKEARGWNHTNFFNAAKPRRGGPKRWALTPPRRSTALDAARKKIKRLQAEIKQKNNQIMQLKRINKAQKPMKGDVVNEGTYAYYKATGQRIMALLNSNEDWSKVMVPGIRREVNGMLGTDIQWKGKR